MSTRKSSRATSPTRSSSRAPGPDVGLLIGRHGQTIDAIQYLLNVIGYRAHGEEKRDVVVDAAGYRARRQATLESLADRGRRPRA